MGHGLASQIHAGLIAGGLTPTGFPLDNTMTLTNGETTAITNAITGYNQTIATLTQARQIPLVDANACLSDLNSTGLEGASGKFVLVDPATTAFSLDGVHVNNAGSAIIANKFIEKINATLSLDPPIPSVDVSEKLGQYLPAPPKLRVTKAVTNAKEIFH
jgi:lysophospholipase L1-like esterase